MDYGRTQRLGARCMKRKMGTAFPMRRRSIVQMDRCFWPFAEGIEFESSP